MQSDRITDSPRDRMLGLECHLTRIVGKSGYAYFGRIIGEG